MPYQEILVLLSSRQD